MTTATTLIPNLTQFNVPDTSTPVVGRLGAADLTYEVLATKAVGTDEYAQISTWICTKSNGVDYARVASPTPPVTDGISEAALTNYLQKFTGFVYSVSNPRYTARLPGVTLPLAPPKQNSCCIFGEDLVVHAFEMAGWSFVWDQARHDGMMVADWNALWSPPYVLIDAGLALPGPTWATPATLPEPWSYCQGWGPNGGHSFIVVATHAATGKVLVLDSSKSHGYSGPGFWGVGDLDQFLASGPPADWWDEAKYPNVPTWADLIALYSMGLAYAQLRVLTSSLVWGRL